MTLRIGIDLDNTLVDYTQAFNNYLANSFNCAFPDKISKKSVKKFLYSKGGDLLWQKCQFEVYSFKVPGAQTARGLKKFIAEMRGYGEIFIISHKSNFAAYDEQKTRNLRSSALDWLKAKSIISPNSIAVENVFFANTIEEKIKFIANLKITHFIDDLEQILSHPSFPIETKRYLFSNLNVPGFTTVNDFTHLVKKIIN